MSPSFQTGILVDEFLSVRQLLVVVLILIVREHREVPHTIDDDIHEHGGTDGEEEREEDIAGGPDVRRVEPTA